MASPVPMKGSVTSTMFDTTSNGGHVYEGVPTRGEHADDDFPQPIRNKHRQKRQRLKLIRLVSQSATVLFAGIMFAFMIYVFARFLATKDLKADGRTAWAKQSKVWPTIMLLAGAAFTLAASVLDLFAFCICFEKFEYSKWITGVRYVVQVSVWIVLTVVYRVEKSRHNVNNDLWGWSCANENSAVQAAFKDVLDFKTLCNIQVSTPLVETFWLQLTRP